MKLSLNWLHEYVDINVDVEQLAYRLTMSGLEVDSIEKIPGDTILDVDLTPNRSDCLSFIGISREIAGFLKKKLRYPEIKISEAGDPICDSASVTIEALDQCFRYAARLVFGVKIAQSPLWLKNRLESIGVRPVNNVVDVTNFVMMEFGQPLHAFDFNRLEEGRIVVRMAGCKEAFTTLDNVQRELSSEMLVIADAKRTVALAGVMGGVDTEVTQETTRVFIESAYFNPLNIRRTSKLCGLKTESSHRFERGVDPEGQIRGLDRAAQLILEVAGGKIAKGRIDEYPKPQPARNIILPVARTNQLLGFSLSAKEMADRLESIEINAVPCDYERIQVTPPSFRTDLERPIDIIEEVARIEGYENIPTNYPLAPLFAKKPDKRLVLRKRLIDLLVGYGLSQTITYSFIAEPCIDWMLFAADDKRRRVTRVLNPLAEDQAAMRTSLIPGLLNTMKYNQNQNNNDLSIFELGKVFFYTKNDSLPDEIEMCAGLITGARYARSWHAKGINVDFYDIKGVIEALFKDLHTHGKEFRRPKHYTYLPYLRPGHAAKIYLDNLLIGEIGEVSHQVLEKFELKSSAFIFSINLDTLLSQSEKFGVRTVDQEHGFRFPSVDRDLAIIIDESIDAQSIIDFLYWLNEPLVTGIEIFDMYRGKQISPGKKSIALRIIYRAEDRTLEDADVTALHARLGESVSKTFNASFRQG
ncbi:MAG: phenylalanine--tRNA ligase subunit beta [Pseudomonadota bacterium]